MGREGTVRARQADLNTSRQLLGEAKRIVLRLISIVEVLEQDLGLSDD